MLLVFKGIKQEYIYVADTEYDNMKLLQSAGLVFKRVDERNDIYQLWFSFNYYIKKDKVGYYTNKITGLNANFLKENGIPINDFPDTHDSMFENINKEDVLFVSHGTKGDRKVLRKAGATFIPAHSFCTYKNGKRILNRESGNKLSDMAELTAFHLNNSHDAYFDALATSAVFSFLKKVEWQDSL